MQSLGTPTRERDAEAFVTHVNVGGIRYLPLAPVADLRSAVREYLDTRSRCETLRYLAGEPSVVLCRDDCERVLAAASGAATDYRLSMQSRHTFERICSVLNRAVPWVERMKAVTAN